MSKLIRDDDNKYILEKSKIYDEFHKVLCYKDLFSEIFNSLAKYYRNEYVYKSYIVNKLLLGKYSLNTTVAINEFRIGNSIADLVLINGTSKVFEIKTELDSPKRLLNQIADYKKVFSEVYVVTHETMLDKYLPLLPKDVGLIILTHTDTLRTIRDAKPDLDFDNTCIMKCLRKAEYSNIIKKYYGYLPIVQAVKYHKECLSLFIKIAPEKLHELLIAELKKRELRCKEKLASPNIPFELKSICLNLDLNVNEYLKLEKLLTKRLT